MKTTKMVLILVLALGLASISLAATEETWTKKADMPTVRFDLSTSVVDGKIYAIGGRDQGVGGAVFPTVEEDDPAADTWTQKADMPTPRTSLSTSVVDGKIYAIGGISDASYGYRVPTGIVYPTVEEYDPATDTWTQKADMPTARHCLSTSVVDGKIYAIGGLGKPGVTDAWGNLAATVVEEYDPATDSWTTKASIPGGKHWLSTSVVDGKIYAIGGKVIANAWATVEEYDPATDTWTRKTNMPTARWGLSTSVVDGNIYAIGGTSGWSGAPPMRIFSTMEEYDPATDTWTKKPDMPTERCLLSTSAVNGKIYAIGGSLGGWASFVATSTVEEYNPISLVVDFNGDFKIDIEDLIILIEHWGQDDPMCDIAPAPFGDGIVDVQDLEVFMSYWGQEVYDPRLIAHWKLDETEGSIAYDSIGGNDGTVRGDPLWQPTAGQIDGALAFDGTDDYVGTDFVLNPADGPFSVFAWIRGGAPGQVIISQVDGEHWLLSDPSEGKLMTEFKTLGRDARELLSQTVITDGNWHRVGFVWDGSDLTLYVDDAEEAADTQGTLAYSTAGLHIGAGSTLDAGSFWSGLIDDVRIYDRAITP